MNWRGVLLLILKVVVFSVMLYIIAERVFFDKNFHLQAAYFRYKLADANPVFLLLAMALMPLNWMLETVKWKQLLSAKVSFTQLLKGVLAGITFGFITPGRAGEFIGRVFYLEGVRKTDAFYLSALGGISQTAVTVGFGAVLIGLWSGNPFMSGLSTGISAAFLFFYYRFDLISRWMQYIPFVSKNELSLDTQAMPSVSILSKVLFISLVRYLVYIFQYVLLALFFGVSTQVLELFVRSGVFMVIQTFTPLMPSVDITYRGGTALMVFSGISESDIAVLCVAAAGWLINLCLPAIAGYVFIFSKRNTV